MKIQEWCPICEEEVTIDDDDCGKITMSNLQNYDLQWEDTPALIAIVNGTIKVYK
jgi:hypothetical protein